MSAEVAREAARQLIETVPGLMQAVASEMRHCHAPMTMPHFRTLMMLALKGPFTVTEIAHKQRVSLPTMSNTVSILVERGWVERSADETDRRRTEVALTDGGRLAVREMHGRIEALLAERLQALEEDDLAKVAEGLAVLRRAFGAHPSTVGDAAEGR